MPTISKFAKILNKELTEVLLEIPKGDKMKTKTMHDNETGANYEIKVQDTKITITAHITNSNELRQFQHDLEELAEDILYPTIESSQ